MKFPIAVFNRLSCHLTRRNSMDHSTLVLAQVLFRHGHRTPDEVLRYTGDPYENETYMPYGKGELTLIGRKQSYAFGNKLRERYGDFLGPEYYNGIVDAKSSAVPRARTTLELVLAGLFPPTKDMKIHDSLNWHPVPYTFTPRKEDQIIAKAVYNLYNHEDHPDFPNTADSQEIIKCVQDKLHWTLKQHAQCFLIYDIIRTQISLGLKMPEWCKDIYPDKLKRESIKFLRHNYNRPQFVIGGSGGMLKEFNDVMWRKVKEIDTGNCDTTKIPKLFLYSGHDVNIAGMLQFLGHFDPARWPKYMANLIFELHRIDNKYYVQILYQDGQNDDSKEYTEISRDVLKLPNCDNEICTLSEFSQYAEVYFPVIPSSI